MSDSEDSQPSRKQPNHNERPPLTQAWTKQATPASANNRDRRPSGSAKKGSSKLLSPVTPSTGTSAPHPFARTIMGEGFLVHAPLSAHSGATSSSSTEDQEPPYLSLATSTPSGKRPLDDLRSRIDTPMTIATSDSTLSGATYSYPSHEVTFVHSSRLVSRLRANELPDFLIRHYALLTVTIQRSSFPTSTLRIVRDTPFALFACYAMLCGSSALREAYMHVLEMGSGARDPTHLQLVGDHVNAVLSNIEEMRHLFSPDILCGLHSYVGHFRSHLDDPVGFPLKNGASLPFSRLARLLSRNLSLQTVLAFFYGSGDPHLASNGTQ